jgi:hypothetical protein
MGNYLKCCEEGTPMNEDKDFEVLLTRENWTSTK